MHALLDLVGARGRLLQCACMRYSISWAPVADYFVSDDAPNLLAHVLAFYGAVIAHADEDGLVLLGPVLGDDV